MASCTIILPRFSFIWLWSLRDIASHYQSQFIPPPKLCPIIWYLILTLCCYWHLFPTWLSPGWGLKFLSFLLEIFTLYPDHFREPGTSFAMSNSELLQGEGFFFFYSDVDLFPSVQVKRLVEPVSLDAWYQSTWQNPIYYIPHMKVREDEKYFFFNRTISPS